MAAKRKFIDVVVPMISESISVLGTVESLQGRTIKLDMARKMRGKGLELTFAIIAENNKLVALPKTLSLMRSYTSRVVRKGTSYIEDSFTVQCKDVPATVKPLLVARKKVSRSIRNHLRRECKELLVNYLKEKLFLEACQELYTGELQHALIPKLKKIYPLAFCDLRVFETKDISKVTPFVPKVYTSSVTQADEIDQFQEAQAESAKAEKAAEPAKESAEEKSEEKPKDKKSKKEKKEDKKEETTAK